MTNIERVLAHMKEELHMSPSELSRATGESAQSIGNWKKRGNIPIDKLEKVSKAIDRSIDWIVTGKDFTSTDTELLSQVQANYAKSDITTRYAINTLLKPESIKNETMECVIKLINSLS